MSTAGPPIIAVVASHLPRSETPRRPVGHVALSDRYAASLHRAGARVLLLPALPGAPAAEPGHLLGDADGLLLAGGGDLDPARYGQAAHRRSYGFDPARDELELALATYALGRDLPLLAVCRGAQVVNVACGGTLHQHLPELPGYHVDAHGRPHDIAFAEHPVTAEPHSRLAEVVGATVLPRCLSAHHQAVDRVGAGLRVTARSDDGCIEAMEPTRPHPFAVAVQWHPEMTADADNQQQALFDWLVAAARRRAERPAVAPA